MMTRRVVSACSERVVSPGLAGRTTHLATRIKRLLSFAALAIMGVILVAAPDAHAVLSGELTVANANLATQGAGPYADWTVTLSGNTVTVSGTGINGFVFGDGGILDVNLSTAAGSVVANSFSSSTAGLAFGGSGNVDGFGTFTVTTVLNGGFSNPLTSLSYSFMITGSVTEANLLDINDRGASVAGHMALATNTACTGFAANGGSSSSSGVDNSSCTSRTVPEPASIALIGTALVGFAFVGRTARTNCLRS